MLIYAYPMSIPPQPVLVLLGHPWAFAPCLQMELLWSSGVLNRAFWQGLHSELVMGLFDHSKAQFSFKKKTAEQTAELQAVSEGFVTFVLY